MSLPIKELDYYLSKAHSKLQEKYVESLKILDETRQNILRDAEKKFNEKAEELRRVAKKQ